MEHLYVDRIKLELSPADRAYLAGKQARKDGLKLSANPYLKSNQFLMVAWDCGYFYKEMN